MKPPALTSPRLFLKVCSANVAIISLLFCTRIGAVSFTQSHAYGLNNSDPQPDEQTDIEFGDSFAFAGPKYDIANNGVVSTVSGAAITQFFRNYAAGFGSATFPPPPINDGGYPGVGSGTASYVLSWEDTGAGTSGDIIGPLGSSDIFGKHSVAFTFVYGTAYSIQSTLTADAVDPGGDGSADSLWSDTFTFRGQPDGTIGIASFRVKIDGGFMATTTAEELPNSLIIYNTDTSAGASAELKVGLPPRSWIETGSGARVTGLPDDGSTVALLLLSLLPICSLVKRGGGQSTRRPISTQFHTKSVRFDT